MAWLALLTLLALLGSRVALLTGPNTTNCGELKRKFARVRKGAAKLGFS